MHAKRTEKGESGEILRPCVRLPRDGVAGLGYVHVMLGGHSIAMACAERERERVALPLR